jgi:predicted metal-binding protein
LATARHHKKKADNLIGCRLCHASSRERTRTSDPVINSHLLYQLSYAGMYQPTKINPVPDPVNPELHVPV